MELRYYKMPEGSPILALLGQKWIQNYGNDIDYLHFHNYLEKIRYGFMTGNLQ